MKRQEFRAMGSHMMVALDTSSQVAERYLSFVPDWFENWEQALSRFRSDSELSRLNRFDNQPVTVSETLWEVFHTAREAEAYTGGLIRPTVLDALLQAGYDRTFQALPNFGQPTFTNLLELPSPTSVIIVDEAHHTLNLPEGVHLDFGGIAKGWAADKASWRLKKYGPTLVDAGGDITVSGTLLNGQSWPIGIRDPFQPDNHFETLAIKRGGVATSGIDYRRWQQGGIWNHHIIDPRTGLPATTDLMTVTVVAPDAVRAEAAAKAVLILGKAAGLDWLERDPSLAGILVMQTGEIFYSQGMHKFLWRES
jgi:thiamine biosynthesis lipoprotein